jgi:hypothetical protein
LQTKLVLPQGRSLTENSAIQLIENAGKTPTQAKQIYDFCKIFFRFIVVIFFFSRLTIVS